MQTRHGAGQHDIEPAQTGALVGLGVGDGGRLDHDDPVELQALGDRGRNQVDLMLDVAVVHSESAVLDPVAGQRFRQHTDLGVGGNHSYRPGPLRGGPHGSNHRGRQPPSLDRRDDEITWLIAD